MSAESDYWSIKLPYVECNIDDNELIGATFNASAEVWETYFNSGAEGEETDTVKTLSESNTKLRYGIVYGLTDDEGSYIGQVLPHPQEEIGRVTGDGYGIVVSQGDIDIPTFDTFQGAGSKTYSFSSGLTISYDQFADVNYQGEVGIIDENWRKYEEGEGFNSAVSSILEGMATTVLNNTNKGEPIYVFQKTLNKPIKLNQISPLPATQVDQADVDAETVAEVGTVATTTGTGASTSYGGYP